MSRRRAPIDPTRLDPTRRRPAAPEQAQYDRFEASELFCPKCRRSQPVRQHLLLVLPTGNKYEYRCAVCASPVGAREDDDAREFASILTGSGRQR
jgi:hypothetical protein